MKLLACVISFIAAAIIIYCAYIGELQGVAVLASALVLHASRGYLRGGHDDR
jgi:hypothetical protein